MRIYRGLVHAIQDELWREIDMSLVVEPTSMGGWVTHLDMVPVLHQHDIHLIDDEQLDGG